MERYACASDHRSLVPVPLSGVSVSVTESQTMGTCNCTCNLTRLRKEHSSLHSHKAHVPTVIGPTSTSALPEPPIHPAAPGTQTSPLAIGPQHSNNHACLRSDAEARKVALQHLSHFNANSVGDARPVDAGRYWACMTLRSAFDCWADTWRRWWAMDYRDGSLRYSWVPKRRRT